MDAQVHSNFLNNSQKVEKAQVSINGLIHKYIVIYTYNEILFSIKGNELLIHVQHWMNLENITLRKRSQTQKVTYSTIPFV